MDAASVNRGAVSNPRSGEEYRMNGIFIKGATGKYMSVLNVVFTIFMTSYA